MRAAILAALLMTVVSGCGAFTHADTETDREGTTENGVTWSQAGLRIDDAYVVLGAGNTGTLHVSLSNQAAEADELVGLQGAGATELTTGTLPLALPSNRTVSLDEQHRAVGLPLPSPRPSAGTDLTVTLTFARAGETTRDLPVVATEP